ncbi:MAG: hypothetical protein IJK18_05525 [Clostridia bacterium]|nr:hypothetical protein [Clostridia bacterium]
MKIKVLLVIPGKEVQVIKISPNIKHIKAFLGEDLYKVKLNEDNLLIASKNARHDDFNRIYGGNILLGTFLIVSIKKNHRTSMKKRDIRRFTKMFRLDRHQRKIDIYREEYLEKYYLKISENKKINAINTKKFILDMAA